MRVKVNTALDISTGLCGHLWVSPTGFPPTPIWVPSFEMPTIQAHPPGFLLGTVKVARTVNHGWTSIVQDGHDCGPMLCDITLLSPNLLYPLQWPFSSRKPMFAASTVGVAGSPTACMMMVILPMLTCGEPVSLPLGEPVTGFLNSVTVGLTWGDFFYGLANIAVSIAIDAIMNKIAPAGPVDDMAGDFVKKVLPFDKNSLIKNGLGMIGGLITSGGRSAASGGEYPAELKFGVGSPVFNVSLGVSGNKKEGKIELTVGTGPDVGKASVTRDKSTGDLTAGGSISEFNKTVIP